MAVSRLEVVVYTFSLIYCVTTANEKETKLSEIVHKVLIGTARVCMKQVNANETDLEHLRQEPPYPTKSACIVKCLFEKIGIVKENQYSKMGFLTKITPIVFRNKKKLQHMRETADKCEKEINYPEASTCQLGNEIILCLYKYAPELHFKE